MGRRHMSHDRRWDKEPVSTGAHGPKEMLYDIICYCMTMEQADSKTDRQIARPTAR